MSSIGADRLAADEDLVSGHELAAGLEHQLVLVPVVAAEQDQRDEDDGDDQGADPGDPRDQPSRARPAFGSVSLHSGTALASLLSTHVLHAFQRRRSSRPPARVNRPVRLHRRPS